MSTVETNNSMEVSPQLQEAPLLSTDASSSLRGSPPPLVVRLSPAPPISRLMDTTTRSVRVEPTLMATQTLNLELPSPIKGTPPIASQFSPMIMDIPPTSLDITPKKEAPSPTGEEEVETMTEASDWSPSLGEHRMRLRPWLEMNLDNKTIPGLEWLDSERSYFKIPWKHRSKKDWDMEHIKVFMEWARHTGKYQDGQEPDYVAMKTRLRCAFNKAPDIEEVKELHALKCAAPYKVYCFIHKPDVASWKESQANQPTSVPGSKVCAVNPTVQSKVEDDSGTDTCGSGDEEELPERSQMSSADPTSSGSSPSSPKKTLAIKRTKARMRDLRTKAKIRDLLSKNVPQCEVTGVSKPSTLAAAEGLLSLNNTVSSGIISQAGSCRLLPGIQPSGVIPTGLIPSLLLAPPRLPVNPIPTAAIGPLPTPTSMAFQLLVQQAEPKIQLYQNSVPETHRSMEAEKRCVVTTLNQAAGFRLEPGEIPPKLMLLPGEDQQKANIISDWNQQHRNIDVHTVNTPGLMAGGRLQNVVISVPSSVAPQTLTVSVMNQTQLLPRVSAGMYNHVVTSSLQTILPSLKPTTNQQPPNIIQPSLVANQQPPNIIQPSLVAIRPREILTNQECGIKRKQEGDAREKKTNKEDQCVRTVDIAVCKQVLPTIHKSWNRHTKQAPGVTYSNRGNIMTTGIVSTIKRAIARKGVTMADEKRRMREAYNVRLEDHPIVTLSTEESDTESTQSSSTQSSSTQSSSTSHKLVAIVPHSVIKTLPHHQPHQSALSGEGGSRTRRVKENGDILDLRVSPGEERGVVIDLSVRKGQATYNSAPACVTGESVTGESALDLTLKRKCEAGMLLPRKQMKQGKSLAVHAIWDLSKSHHHQDLDTQEKSPTYAVDLRNSPESKKTTEIGGMREQGIIDDDDSEDHNYFSMSAVSCDAQSHGLVVLETDKLLQAYRSSQAEKANSLTVVTEGDNNQDDNQSDTSQEDDDVKEEEWDEEGKITEEEDDDEDDKKLAAKQLVQLSLGGATKVRSVTVVSEEVIRLAEYSDVDSTKKLSGTHWGQNHRDDIKLPTSYVMAKGEGRQRLRPWLENKINSGEIPGLQWIDKSTGQFKIPWKHGGKHDWSPSNSRIFMEWARHTGRYRKGIDEEDYATWKTRLRCAFNKAPDIEEVKDKTNLNCGEPYRVYRLIPKSELQRHLTPGADESDDDSMSRVVGNPTIPTMVQEASSDTTVTPSDLRSLPSIDLLRADVSSVGELPTSYTADGLPCTTIVTVPPLSTEILAGGDSLQDSDQVIEEGVYMGEAGEWAASTSQTINSPLAIQAPTLVQYNNIGVSPEVYSMTGVQDVECITGTVSHPSAVSGITSHAHSVLSETMVYTEAIPVHSDIILEEVGETGMYIQLRYLEDCVADRWVTSDVGCRVTCEAHTDTADTADQGNTGDPNTQELLYPALPQSTDTSSTQGPILALQPFLKHGIIFEANNGDIYATRYCRCGIFYVSAHGTNGEPVKLARNQPKVKIFDYLKDFLPAWQKYKEEGGVVPDPCVHLMVAEKGALSELHHRYISMSMTSVKAKEHLQADTHQEMDCQPSPQESTGFHVSSPDSRSHTPHTLHMDNIALTRTASPPVSTETPIPIFAGEQNDV